MALKLVIHRHCYISIVLLASSTHSLNLPVTVPYHSPHRLTAFNSIPVSFNTWQYLLLLHYPRQWEELRKGARTLLNTGIQFIRNLYDLRITGQEDERIKDSESKLPRDQKILFILFRYKQGMIFTFLFFTEENIKK